jgi:HlyD family secretion protein
MLQRRPRTSQRTPHESSLHEIERAEAGSSQARDQLSKTTIYSPINGTVTILNSKLGERLVATGQFAGTEVMRVATSAIWRRAST